MKSNIKSIASVLIGLIASLSVQAQSLEQDCSGSTTTTADDEFTISELNTGLVLHSESELMWARCVVGQTWNTKADTCDGEPVRVDCQQPCQLSDE